MTKQSSIESAENQKVENALAEEGGGVTDQANDVVQLEELEDASTESQTLEIALAAEGAGVIDEASDVDQLEDEDEDQLEDELANARDLMERSAEEATAILHGILRSPLNSIEAIEIKEKAVFLLSAVLRMDNKSADLKALLGLREHLFSSIQEVQVCKLVRDLLDALSLVLDFSIDEQLCMCKEFVEWSRENMKLPFLRQQLEARMASFMLRGNNFDEALKFTLDLKSESTDSCECEDSHLLSIDVHLLLSELYYKTGNVSLARDSLLTAKASGHLVSVLPFQKVRMYLYQGVMYAEAGDFNNAHRRFDEGFTTYMNLGNYVEAARCLKYQILCKLLVGDYDFVQKVSVLNKQAGGFGREIVAMDCLSTAMKSGSDVQAVVSKYGDGLGGDVFLDRFIPVKK